MGDKVQARDFMEDAGLPLAKGTGLLEGTDEEIIEAGRKVGFPLLVKPSGGGGGIGMVPVHDEEELLAAIERSQNLASRNFSNTKIFLEKLIENPRHIEFQMLGDKNGKVRHLFERDCSVQRRHQKVLEESPAPAIARDVLDTVAEKAAEVLSIMGYDNIGTVEMLLGADGTFSFLEMNTRLQVEHAVTEMVTGIDLVRSQILSAAGSSLEEILPDKIQHSGHAIEARVYAEDPKNFFPSPGPLTVYRPPRATANLRVETGFCEGMNVSNFYDPMLAKVIAWAPTREAAIAKLKSALETFKIEGVKNNIPFVLQVLNSDDFLSGNIDTAIADRLKISSRNRI
jgi:acetyl-CoA carboxylase biotin carboxylase subunit